MKKILLTQKGDYSLFARLTKDNQVIEYVVAWLYDINSDSWSQGHYIKDLQYAIEFFNERTQEEEEEEEEEEESIIVNNYKLNGYKDLCDYAYESRMYDYYDYFEE